MAVDSETELARQIGAAENKGVGTMMGDGRRDPRDAPGRGRKTSLLPLVADLRRPADCDRVVAMTMSRFGGVKILVNNAGLTSRRSIRPAFGGPSRRNSGKYPTTSRVPSSETNYLAPRGASEGQQRWAASSMSRPSSTR
jgi:NAD(P)-dependent dehydrogenase (short-subunit alcohol dehydrogenase family)